MYDFYYGYIKNEYRNNAKLLFTDSLTNEIKTEDVYKDFWDDKNKFKNSDYPEKSQFYDKHNKKVIEKFKDEAAGKPIKELAGFRSKMYSYIKSDGKNDKTAKGIKKNVMKNNIKHINQWCSIVTQNENHLNCKSSNRQLRIEQNFIKLL